MIITNLQNNLHYYIGFFLAIFVWLSYFLFENFNKNIYSTDIKENKLFLGSIILSFILVIILVIYWLYITYWRSKNILVNIFMLFVILMIFIFIHYKFDNNKLIFTVFFGFFIIFLLMVTELFYLSSIDWGYIKVYFVFMPIMLFILFFIYLKGYFNPKCIHKIILKNKKKYEGVILNEYDDSVTCKIDKKVIFILKKDIKEIEEVKEN